MSVKLIAITKPVIEGLEDAEDLISYCARVSSPNNQLKTETAGKLLRYCFNHKHFSIFEQANVTLEFETTRDIGRQLLRHWSMRPQEFSQRYSEADEEPVIRECRLQDVKNRQNSIVTDDTGLADGWEYTQRIVWDTCYSYYKEALSKGIAKEVARAILPEGLTRTRLYMNGSLRSWMHWILIRAGKETQKEHRLLAKEAAKILESQFDFLKEVFAPIYDDEYSAEE